MSDSTLKTSLFRGRFNWYGQVIPKDGNWLYTHAMSEAQAFNFFCQRLTDIVNTSLFNVRHYFYDSNKYEIYKEEEEQKDEAQQSGNARRS
jgi:hypothetical protein